jgi:transposase-like protein
MSFLSIICRSFFWHLRNRASGLIRFLFSMSLSPIILTLILIFMFMFKTGISDIRVMNRQFRKIIYHNAPVSHEYTPRYIVKVYHSIPVRSMRCKYCYSEKVMKDGKVKGQQVYKCKNCERGFYENGNFQKMRNEKNLVVAALSFYYDGLSRFCYLFD